MTDKNKQSPRQYYFEEAVSCGPKDGQWNSETDLLRARKFAANCSDIRIDSIEEEKLHRKFYALAIDPHFAVQIIVDTWPELNQDPIQRVEMARRMMMTYCQLAEREVIAGRQRCGDEFEGKESSTSSVHMIDGLATQMMDKVHSKRLEWLWPKRFPIGKVSLLAGYPDQGKSLITLKMAATITTGGEWPNNEGTADAGIVIILTSEDTAEDTIKPRLMAARADLSKIMNIKSMVTETVKNGKVTRVFNLAEDLAKLTKAVEEFRAKYQTVRMVVFDPLNAYFGGKRSVDSHNTSEMRALLTPISEWCAKMNVAVVGIMHFNKGDNAHALYRITGSNAIGAVARAAWITIEDPETKKTMMLRGKANLSKKEANTGLAYSIGETTVDDPEFDDDLFPFIEWGEAVDVSANDALKPPSREREALALNIASRELAAFLAEGPKLQSEIDQLAKDVSVSDHTMRRAKETLGVQWTKPDKFGGKRRIFMPKPSDFFPDEFEGQDKP